eukprot:TRINITY_DN31384_c0_g1_i1.p1 TRINITY_DN31384_c0_g1~~TRINITY_DN31384_c0_g1_i1.p1  ORF type:complete len:556 (+),score=115.25 TRINITY_DN31384_c0_g1_i1:230-1669(+)
MDIHSIYELEGILGEGAFGVVKKCINKESGRVRVVKTMIKDAVPDEQALYALFNEVTIQAGLDHPHVCKIFEVFEDHVHLHVVEEIFDGGDLCEQLVEAQAFTEHDASMVMKQVMQAVLYLHGHELAHRDIKPENFLLKYKDTKLEENIVKMIDFGFATVCSRGFNMQTMLGTPWYTAPEILQGSYNELCDVYSCGVMLYIFLSGAPPFDSEDNEEILQMAANGKVDFSDDAWSDVSGAAKHLIMRMMKKDVGERCSARDVLDSVWMQKEQQKCPRKELKVSASSLMSKLQRHHTTTLFVQAALPFVAKSLDDKHLQNLEAQFMEIDADGDGEITFEEMKQACIAAEVDDETLSTLFKSADVDGSGKIEYTEFLTCMLQHNQMVEREALWEAFRVFDSDGNGMISSSELKEGLEIHHEGIDQDTVDRMMIEVDESGDGEIDFEEFLAMFTKTNVSHKWRYDRLQSSKSATWGMGSAQLK